jgi:hypothetical protein
VDPRRAAPPHDPLDALGLDRLADDAGRAEEGAPDAVGDPTGMLVELK